MVVGKRTHDKATAAQDSSGNNNNSNSNSNSNNNGNNNNNNNNNNDNDNDNDNNMDIVEENDNNMDIVEEKNDVHSTEESMETSTTTTEAPAAAAAAAAAMIGDRTENEKHQYTQQESPNTTTATIEDCAKMAVNAHLSDYDDKTRGTVVKTIVDEFSRQQTEKSKEQLASHAHAIFHYMTSNAVLPDDRLSTNETLRSTIVDSFWHNMIEHKILQPNQIPGRIAPLDFQIVESTRSHRFDVDAFIKQVCLTKETWEKQINATGNQDLQMMYDAPYFCCIQSSGMGKTKIMYEAVKELNKSSKYGCWKCALIMPWLLMNAQITNPDAKDKKVAFDYKIDFSSCFPDSVNSIFDQTRACFKKLDELLENITGPAPAPAAPPPPDASSPMSLPKNNNISVLLCFDEAQAFLEKATWNDGNVEKIEKAYFFRVIRLWLRLKKHNQHQINVVAVFAGTNASIANFRFERDDAQILLPRVPPSRDWTPRQVDYMHRKGRQFFPVFTNITTIGCLAKSALSSPPEDSDGSYKRAIQYGRPLFAMLDQKGCLDEPGGVMISILGRMLQTTMDNEEWKKNDVSWFSVLATRVQMGQTSYEIASDLVARGYANLLGVSANEVRITYMPDPVCARLAMGMMSDSFNLGRFQGMGGTFWAEKLSALFQRGLCVPQKGDIGEIFVALYFLLCGDILRTQDSSTIQLDKWISLLKCGGRSPDDIVNTAPVSDSSMVVETAIETSTVDSKAARRSLRLSEGKEKGRLLLEANEKDATDTIAAPITLESGSEVSINFIQVCRNNLRSFGVDWVGFKNETFLHYLFDSAVAFYVYPGCPLIDFVAPIKIIRRNEVTRYVPLLVSIKAHEYFCPAKAETACEAMKDEAKKSKLDTALCLLVVFGSSASAKTSDIHELVLSDDSIAQALLEEKIVGKVLRIPTDDKFDLSKQFRAVTTPGLETEEIFASHSFIRAFNGDAVALDSKNALRAKPSKEAKSMLDDLKDQLKQK